MHTFPTNNINNLGAQIVSASEALKADILIRVRKPSAAEVAELPNGAILISHIESCEQDETLKQVLDKEVVFLAMERVPRISRAQAMDALSSQSNIFRLSLSHRGCGPLWSISAIDDDLGRFCQTSKVGCSWCRCCRICRQSPQLDVWGLMYWPTIFDLKQRSRSSHLGPKPSSWMLVRVDRERVVLRERAI